MFAQPIDMIFFGIGGVIILFNRLYMNREKWYLFVIFAIASIYTGSQVNNIIILKNNRVYQEYTTFFSNYTYSFQNGSTKNIAITDNMIINDSDYSVIVEKAFYSPNGGTTNQNPFVASIYPYTTNNSLPKIDYIFNDPPQKISEKGGGEKTIYWLHY
ncbi:MAG: hypothetical protein RLY43_1767 [Bacteroidota bacterium]|jgi:hypothetical protein